ncbi:MAG TPA: ABC transporter ATP-binding protein [Ilumatobacter sp.]|nr:ABC transporter ATP-binding protein [Ilumatobacter sp.]
MNPEHTNDEVGELVNAVSVVEMSAVTKTYAGARPVTALTGCDLRIDRGEYLAIMGPSGSGKSTLLNILGLLDEPTTGEYLLNGQPTAALSEAQRCDVRAHEIGFVFQSFHLVAYRSAVENVETGLLYQRIGRRQRRRQAVEVLERVGLAERMWATPTEMSGGERQRVAVARALVRRPAVVLCDEPTGNLDTRSGGQVLDLLDELSAEGLTIVVITHDPAVAARTRRLVEISDGIVTGGIAGAIEARL